MPSLSSTRSSAGDPQLIVTFPVAVPKNFSEDEVRAHLQAQGYTRIHRERIVGNIKVLDVIADRFRISNIERSRVIEALERALRLGVGRVDLHPAGTESDSVSGLQQRPALRRAATFATKRRMPARSRSTHRWALAKRVAALGA